MCQSGDRHFIATAAAVIDVDGAAAAAAAVAVASGALAARCYSITVAHSRK